MQILTLKDIEDRSRVCGDCWEYGPEENREHARRYPQVKHEGKPILVRRLAFELKYWKIKKGYSVVPTCGNHYCVNPAHNKAMTESQKGKFYAANGAWSRSNNPGRAKKIAQNRRSKVAKLTPEQAQEIRLSAESGPVLSERYGVDRSRINKIKRGEAWKDYSNPFMGLGA